MILIDVLVKSVEVLIPFMQVIFEEVRRVIMHGISEIVTEKVSGFSFGKFLPDIFIIFPPFAVD